MYDQPNYNSNSSYDNVIITICLRLESLCKSDSAKVRLRLGTSASSFSLNSSLVPGTLFNCHLELALDSSKLGEQVTLSCCHAVMLSCCHAVRLS